MQSLQEVLGGLCRVTTVHVFAGSVAAMDTGANVAELSEKANFILLSKTLTFAFPMTVIPEFLAVFYDAAIKVIDLVKALVFHISA